MLIKALLAVCPPPICLSPPSSSPTLSHSIPSKAVGFIPDHHHHSPPQLEKYPHTHTYQTLLLKAQRRTHTAKIDTSWGRPADPTNTHTPLRPTPPQIQRHTWLPRWKNKWRSCVGLFEFLLLEKLGQGTSSGSGTIHSFKENSQNTYTVLLKVTSYSQNWMTAYFCILMPEDRTSSEQDLTLNQCSKINNSEYVWQLQPQQRRLKQKL